MIQHAETLLRVLPCLNQYTLSRRETACHYCFENAKAIHDQYIPEDIGRDVSTHHSTSVGTGTTRRQLCFFLLSAALGQVPGGAPFSQRSKLATACTNRMQIDEPFTTRRQLWALETFQGLGMSRDILSLRRFLHSYNLKQSVNMFWVWKDDFFCSNAAWVSPGQFALQSAKPKKLPECTMGH